MKIFPAIDLMDGKAVRLTKGDFSTKEVFSDNPVEVLRSFVGKGAGCLHVVDLDGARTGSPKNFSVIRELCLESGVFVEVGGGIRDRERIVSCLETGASRVILGTAAVKNFDFVVRSVKEFGERIAVGVDAQDGKVAIEGWETLSDLPSVGFCIKCRDAGVKTVVYTDISTDGAMKGTNMDAMKRLAAIDGLNVVASGGISNVSEIAELKSAGIYGAILGKALYKGLIDLSEAVALAEGRE